MNVRAYKLWTGPVTSVRVSCCRALVLGALSLSVAAPGWSADRRIDFTHDIRPFLSNKCFACHGPDEAERKGGVDGLRLDSLAGATADLGDGGRAIVPGDPAASRLIARITSDDPAERMPPAEFGKPLTAEEIEQLRAVGRAGGRVLSPLGVHPAATPRGSHGRQRERDSQSYRQLPAAASGSRGACSAGRG